jgi:hypothetical protein
MMQSAEKGTAPMKKALRQKFYRSLVDARKESYDVSCYVIDRRKGRPVDPVLLF